MVAATPATTYGAELTPALSTFTGAGGATWSSPNWNIPSGATIACPVTVTSGQVYQIALTRGGSSGGDMTVTLGSASITIPAAGNSAFTLTAAATGSVTLTIGGGTWVCTTISGVGVTQVTAFTSPLASTTSIRVVPGSSIGIGTNAQQYLTIGTGNTAIGASAQRSITTGSYNNAMGYCAQYALTTGSNNTGIGQAVQYSLTSGSSNCAVGQYAQNNLVTGAYNNALGYGTQQGLTTGSFNTAMGHGSQYALTTGSNNTALGYFTQRTDGTTATISNLDRGIAIGYNAQNTANNTAVIGGALNADRVTLCLGNYGQIGSGQGGISLTNNVTDPTTNPTGGGILYSSAGALKWRGS